MALILVGGVVMDWLANLLCANRFHEANYIAQNISAQYKLMEDLVIDVNFLGISWRGRGCGHALQQML
ncbi:hypothetical protein [Pseudomonas sp. EggHat1]|uniref:hypothetical protein n=1 Tax=Pseudomonas sp. EggHat1 TaxID=2761624 RepID=UPI0018693538|nr:hypothetical protein [Pseudomonas sp. EggHat1]